MLKRKITLLCYDSKSAMSYLYRIKSQKSDVYLELSKIVHTRLFLIHSLYQHVKGSNIMRTVFKLEHFENIVSSDFDRY